MSAPSEWIDFGVTHRTKLHQWKIYEERTRWKSSRPFRSNTCRCLTTPGRMTHHPVWNPGRWQRAADEWRTQYCRVDRWSTCIQESGSQAVWEGTSRSAKRPGYRRVVFWRIEPCAVPLPPVIFSAIPPKSRLLKRLSAFPSIVCPLRSLRLENRLTPVVVEMENNGFKIN